MRVPEASGGGLRTAIRLELPSRNYLSRVFGRRSGARTKSTKGALVHIDNPDVLWMALGWNGDGTPTARPRRRRKRAKKPRERRAPFAKRSANLVICQMRIAPGASGNGACASTLGAGTSIPGCGPTTVKSPLGWRVASSPGQALLRQWRETV